MIPRSFDEAVRLLHNRTNFEHRQSFAHQELEGRLDLMREILALLDHPETNYRTVHIAGTKGKGSTCVLLESLLLGEGYHVGRFTSPHVHCFTERLMIDGVPCPPDEFAELMFSLDDQIEPEILNSLTYFELLTLLAFVYFARKNVDIAVVEVGLGGRLDATNVCQPDVSVITSISFDHMEQLGPTLSHIAAEKSGIIKPGVPVVTTVLNPEPQKVIREKAQSMGAPLYVLDEHFFVRQTSKQYSFQYKSQFPQFPVELTLDNLSLKMPGTHQIQNAAAAISAFLLVHQGLLAGTPMKEPEYRLNAFLPLRFEVIRRDENSPTIVFDGAHNRDSMRAFVKTLTEMYPHRHRLLIFGASLDKDVSGMFAEIDGNCSHLFLTQSSDSSRRFPPQELLSMFPSPDENVSVMEDCNDAWEQCTRMATKESVICITGSLYLAAELRRHAK